MQKYSNYYHNDIKNFIKRFSPKSNYIILSNSLTHIEDVQKYLGNLRKKSTNRTRVVVIYFNFIWKPFLDLASLFGLREKDKKEPNWLSPSDISNLFKLEGFEEVKKGKRFLFPINFGRVSDFINQYISQLPLINSLCLTTYQVFRVIPKTSDYSVSIIIPARNEAGNMKGVLSKIPKLGTKTEVVFVEGHSTDNTWAAIQSEIAREKKGKITASLYKQKGKGKADAVKLGFRKAKNDILMILDADLTVNPNDLVKFYNAVAGGTCEFANGSRLVYPMESQAMRVLNYLGNKLFSIIFTYLLGQHIGDTLCGTKVLFKKDYQAIVRGRKYFGDFDPFGDFDLLFGASRLNLKIIDIPIRYRDRTYGETNISRFTHGWLLIKMTIIAAKKIKFA